MRRFLSHEIGSIEHLASPAARRRHAGRRLARNHLVIRSGGRIYWRGNPVERMA
jgi:hypothetical protein